MRLQQTDIIQSPDVRHRFSDQDFELDYWRDRADSQALAGGRGASQKIIIDDAQYVLRHYLRGGLVAKLLKDQYLWTGLKRTRPFQENEIVELASAHKLPVAPVAAFRVERSGLYYRAAIITAFIENRGTLAEVLTRSALDAIHWRELGLLIRRLHQAGIYHADLNANNILLGENNAFYLIDFDKAQRMPTDSDRGEQNVQRLKRSLDKIALQRQQSSQLFYFREADWARLMVAYDSSSLLS